MSETALAPFRARLPRLDPSRARAQNRALEVLSALAVEHDGVPLQVQVSVRDAYARGAFVFAAPPGWLSVVPEVVDGAPAPALDPQRDLTAALSALGRLEPVLAAVERTSGTSLDPLGVETEARPGTLVLGLELRDAGGRLVHALTINISAQLADTWPAPAGAHASLGAAFAAPARCRLLVDGPSMDRAALSALEPGAMVLLPRAAREGWPASLATDTSDKFARGWIEWPRLCFVQSSFEDGPMVDRPLEEASVVEPSVSDQNASAGGFLVNSLPVTVRVAFDQVQTSVAELARLQPGSTLVLPDLGDNPRVTLLAEDRAVAEGRLVSLGEAYGILIEHVNA